MCWNEIEKKWLLPSWTNALMFLCAHITTSRKNVTVYSYNLCIRAKDTSPDNNDLFTLLSDYSSYTGAAQCQCHLIPADASTLVKL